MPDGKQREGLLNANSLSLEEKRLAQDDPDSDYARSNVDRAPSQQVSVSPPCGGKVTKNSQRYLDWVAAGEQGPRPVCQKPAGWGTDHPGFGYCKFHGGNTSAGVKSAAKAQVAAWVSERKKTLGDRDDPAVRNITPDEVLLEEVRRSTALVRWLEEKIQMWDLDSPDIEMASGLGLPALVAETAKGTPGATDAQVWLMIYREEREHMVKVAKMTLDAGIAERQVKLAEQQGLILAAAIRQVLNALALTPEQHAAVPAIVPGVLRQLSVDVRSGGGAIVQGELVPGD